MNTSIEHIAGLRPIRSVDFAAFEKPKAQPHWSYDESLTPKRKRKGLTLDSALAALRAISGK